MDAFCRWLALSVFLLPACLNSVAAVHAGPFKTVRDWHVNCTNALTCTMSTYPTADKIHMFGFERGAEASAPLTVFLSSGLTINEESDIVIRFDGGEPDIYLEIPKAILNDGVWRFSEGQQANRLLDAMMAGSSMTLFIEAAEGDGKHNVTLNGVTAAALYMDDVQGRVGNQDALKAKGDGIPTAATTRVKDYNATDELPAAVARFWRADHDQCSEGAEPNEDLIARFGATSITMLHDTQLYILPCGLPGAYNLPQVVLAYSESTESVRKMPLPVMGERGPSVLGFLYNSSWNDRESELTAIFKGRGLGDCGSQYRWHFEGGYDSNFELVEERSKVDCDGNYDEWPKIWPIE